MSLGSSFETITKQGLHSVVEKLLPKRIAFTLAEVLIVLGIIGLIADMTIPTLKQKIDDKVTVTRLQKIYSTLAQATNLASIENGTTDTWQIYDESIESTNTLYSYYKPSFKVLKDCNNTYDCWAPSKTLAGASSLLGSNIYNTTLSDGTNVMFDVWSTDIGTVLGVKNNVLMPTLVFFVDVNGFKKPNVLGRDIFVFVVNKKGLVPSGVDDETLCTPSGIACTAKVLRENAINY